MTKEEHDFQKLYKGIPWLVCRKCGLIRLRNPLTDWCVKKGCNYNEDLNYKAVVKNLTR